MAQTSNSNGLSGTALAALTIGALLVYAGFRGVSPLQALRDVSGGKPPPVGSKNANLSLLAASPDTSGLGPEAQTPGIASSFGAAVVAAAERHKGDKYSQAPILRTSENASDCSSFAAKAFNEAGATQVKVYWTTLVFRASKLFKVIPTESAQAGDIIITPLLTATNAHMAIVTAPGQAIGNQNPTSNVQEGTFAQIMAGKPSYIAMRYVGPLPAAYSS